MALCAIVSLSCGDGTVEPSTTAVASSDLASAASVGADVSDRAVLEALYNATGGHFEWANRENWLTDEPLRRWHGVNASWSGRVVGLELPHNGLTGPIPPELGGLSELTELDLHGNRLEGTILVELGLLSNLRRLYLHKNQLEGGIPAELGSLRAIRWLALSENKLAGDIPPLDSLPRLEGLWLHGNRLTGRIPRTLGSLSRLRFLSLSGNQLEGPIPAELGGLDSLVELLLSGNRLEGPVPPQLGSAHRLEWLDLSGNRLDGGVPPELDSLAGRRLKRLDLSGNLLEGPIPAKLFSDASRLEWLDLSDNLLVGPIPPELGSVGRLQWLDLSGNGLEKPIPPGLGSARRLEWLDLSGNRLEGGIPPELGTEAGDLERLDLSDNRLEGRIPPELGSLKSLRWLDLSGNDLVGCIPDALKTFTLTINPQSDRAVLAVCGASMAYLTQAIARRPLIANEDALLRVFLAPDRGVNQIPETRVPVIASFYDARGDALYWAEARVPVSADAAEGSLLKSGNAVIPGRVIRPGLEMVIDVYANGSVAEGLGVPQRIPETGRLTVDVEVVPPFQLTAVPLLLASDPDSSVIDTADRMEESPSDDQLLSDALALLPIGKRVKVTAHQPVLVSSDDMSILLSYVRMIRRLEDDGSLDVNGHYMGMMALPGGVQAPGTILGTAYESSWSSVVKLSGSSAVKYPDARLVAHELGHNLGLGHAPCGVASGLDERFPDPNGRIMDWGYDNRSDSLVNPSTADLMSYCSPAWIGGYSFENALKHRLRYAGHDGSPMPVERTRSILLWGGVNDDGRPYLEPAFLVDAVPALPNTVAGRHRLVGRSAEGGELFDLRFDMPEVADADGSSSFAFVVPVSPTREVDLANVTLAGPGGSVRLDGESDLPMAILRDARTGQIRGILRDPPSAAQPSDARAPVRGLEVLFSRGIATPDAWRR